MEKTKMKMRESLLLMLVLIMVIVVVAATADTGGRTRLVGRDGLCLDSDGPSRYNFPKLVPCKPQEDTQLWTLPNDGTIRWTNDRCLFPYGKPVLKEYILVKTGLCNELSAEDKTWNLNQNGNLIHVLSGLVLTVKNVVNTLNVEANRNAPSQIWSVEDGHRPSYRSRRVGHIVGLHSYKCLGFRADFSDVMVQECRRDFVGNYQMWVFYEDGTIRVNANSSLCLTSIQAGPYYPLIVIQCKNSTNQQWELDLKDNTLHHPDSNMVMDFITIGTPQYYLKIVALFPHNGDSTQQWTLME